MIGSINRRRINPHNSGRLRSGPAAHLTEAGLLVVRRSLEDLERRAPIVAGLDRFHVALQVDRALAEGDVLVPVLSVASVVVMEINEPEPIPSQLVGG